jgi:hypothetical protein
MFQRKCCFHLHGKAAPPHRSRPRKFMGLCISHSLISSIHSTSPTHFVLDVIILLRKMSSLSVPLLPPLSFCLSTAKHPHQKPAIYAARTTLTHTHTHTHTHMTRNNKKYNFEFHCFTVHFNSLCVMAQLMHLFVIKH